MNKLRRGQVLWGNRNIFSVAIEEPTKKQPETKQPERVYKDRSPVIECHIKGKRGEQTILDSDFAYEYKSYLVSGDIVLVNHDNMIVKRVERHNFFARIKHGALYVMASNIDAVVLVSSLADPTPRFEFLDRVMVAAKEQGLPLYLCVNKCDLIAPKSRLIDFDKYAALTDALHMISCKTHFGLTALKKSLRRKNVCIIGQSGVGKSTLINALIPDAGQQTGNISFKYQRGRHTTTGTRLIYTQDGAFCDTPGVKDFVPYVYDINNLADSFVEFDAYKTLCKIPRCTHINEPDCGIKRNLGTHIDRKRYQSYTRIMKDLQNAQRQSWYQKKH